MSQSKKIAAFVGLAALVVSAAITSTPVQAADGIFDFLFAKPAKEGPKRGKLGIVVGTCEEVRPTCPRWCRQVDDRCEERPPTSAVVKR
jgi:hypothetical protein